MTIQKVDLNQWGLNEKLAKKYNAIANAITSNNKEWIFENGCINVTIESIEYVREDNKNNPLKYDEYIKIKENTYNKTLYISNPKSLKIDKKYNTIIQIDKLEV